MGVEIEVFGLDIFFGFAGVGAIVSLFLWLWVAVRLRGRLDRGVLHTIVVALTIATFVLIDLSLIAGLMLQVPRLVFRVMVAFAFGVQMVAAISAILMIRQTERRRRAKDV